MEDQEDENVQETPEQRRRREKLELRAQEKLQRQANKKRVDKGCARCHRGWR